MYAALLSLLMIFELLVKIIQNKSERNVIMEKTGKQIFPIDEDEDDSILTGEVVSAQDCTGLIPSLPRNKGNVESYTDLYDIPHPENSTLNDMPKSKSGQKGKEQRE